MTDQSAHGLRAQAAWCRTLANGVSDAPIRNILRQTAAEFEAEAKEVDASDAALVLAESGGPGANGI